MDMTVPADVWPAVVAVKLALAGLVLRWLHRKGWLAIAARFVQANWAQVIGLLLLGFIALKLGGVDFPGWRWLLGVPETRHYSYVY